MDKLAIEVLMTRIMYSKFIRKIPDFVAGCRRTSVIPAMGRVLLFQLVTLLNSRFFARARDRVMGG